MDKQQKISLQNFDDNKTEILKKRLKSASDAISGSAAQNAPQHNVLLNTLRAPISSSMIVTSMSAPQNPLPITHNLVTHSLAPVKIHTNTTSYPLHLSTVHVPVQIPGSASNINVPVQLSSQTSGVPLQITPANLPIQVSGTTNVPVQLPAGDTINVPLQLPASNQNIHLTGQTLPSMPILQNTNQSLSSIIHVQMSSNPRSTNMDGSTDLSTANPGQMQQLDPSSVHVKLNTATSIPQVQVASSSGVVQIPNSSNNALQLTLPNTGNAGSVQLRAPARNMPHMVYIQTPNGLKHFTSTDVISHSNTSGNPPQIIVRKPICNNANIQLISNMNKPNIAPKTSGQSKAIVSPANTSQPIVIQKPKSTDKMIVPVTIASSAQGKQAIAYLSSLKKSSSKNMTESQSILISNNQPHMKATNQQKLFLTPMNVPKIQNTKIILPVTLPASMSSKGPIINLQIANGQIQNDPQGNITVMRDSASMESSKMPPLQPLPKIINGKDNNTSLESSLSEKSFALSIPGSRAEPTGEKGEYTLSIPETNASMHDDIYTVSIANGEGDQSKEKSFTLAIPEKGKSLLNKPVYSQPEKSNGNTGTMTITAPTMLRRSNSDCMERKSISQEESINTKRRTSLSDNATNKLKTLLSKNVLENSNEDKELEMNDDHRVPSLFCDEKLDKELEAKVNASDNNAEDNMSDGSKIVNNNIDQFYEKFKDDRLNEMKTENAEDIVLEEDPPGLIWQNGLAELNGSTLQFQSNEFGLIDLVHNNHKEPIVNGSIKYHTPLKQRSETTGRIKKPTSPEDLYRCDECGCHGMAADFVTPNFCSLTCKSEYQKNSQRRKEKEKGETNKKKNKIKKMVMNNQMSDTISQQENKDSIALREYNTSVVQLSEVNAEQKNNEDFIINERYPWTHGGNGFTWVRYLEFCKAKSAPLKLFKDPFPYNRNGFKVGMRMEAIDPKHPSLFCVVSVAEVLGYRMRLHFDGYSDHYDYWVNADSKDIFPASWCEKNGRTLQPPLGYTASDFSWPLYLMEVAGITAPRHLFSHVTKLSSNNIKPSSFRVGMKLEAEDRGNDVVCVASITDMIDNRILINFDSWDNIYDFWADPTSPYIHPIGWAEEHEVPLAPPNYYKNPDKFTWESYLCDTGASAAPPRAFKPRPPVGFKPGMKVEVVDQRVPFLVRVATISAVKNHQVQISFDGWPKELSVWLDDDSADIHPVGWCAKTGHPLEPPLSPEEAAVKGECGVGGCRGFGSLTGGAHTTHHTPSLCPYRGGVRTTSPNRLVTAERHSVESRSRRSRRTSTESTPKEKLPRGRPPKHKRIEEIMKRDPVNTGSDSEAACSGNAPKRWRGSDIGSQEAGEARGSRARQRADAPVSPSDALATYTAQLALPHDPTTWTQNEVSMIVSRLAGSSAGAAVARARVTGTDLLMASCEELVHCLHLKLGPAIKVYGAIRQLREILT